MAEKIAAVLDEHDRNSATWKKMKRHFEDRLAKLRLRNDVNHDERKTANIRGSIAELKYLVSLDQDKPQEPPENSLFKD